MFVFIFIEIECNFPCQVKHITRIHRWRWSCTARLHLLGVTRIKMRWETFFNWAQIKSSQRLVEKSLIKVWSSKSKHLGMRYKVGRTLKLKGEHAFLVGVDVESYPKSKDSFFKIYFDLTTMMWFFFSTLDFLRWVFFSSATISIQLFGDRDYTVDCLTYHV